MAAGELPDRSVPPPPEGGGPGPVDDPEGSAPPPPGPEDLDELVDRLAAEQARRPEAAPVAEADRAVLLATEMETLLGILEDQRGAVARKADGLEDGQAGAHLVGSATTVIGIVRHLADTERYWFREVMGGISGPDVGYRWFADGVEDAEWRVEVDASLAEALADYDEACAHSRAQVAGRDGGQELRGLREVRTVRWVVAHMIAETSRHLGHLDVLTELLDGRTGV